MRHLASIRKISDLQPIQGKDRIALATVDGWRVIVDKSKFSVGDLCVFVEVDSVLPEKPEFEFLRSKNFRIKTMRMAGCISQGICFPLDILPSDRSYSAGDDVTDILGVKQYVPTMDVEPDEPSENTSKKKFKYPAFLMRFRWFRKLVSFFNPKKSTEFPSFISKTDETRIQNMPWLLEDQDTMWVMTEKIDGQSGTFALVRHKSRIPFVRDKFEYIVCSRNKRIPVPDNSSYWSVSRKYNIECVLRNMIGDELDWVAIQGEIIGQKIQGNKYGRNEYELYVFNVIDSTNGLYPTIDALNIITKYSRDLMFVPILGVTNLPNTMEEMMCMAHGDSKIADTLREGIVCRTTDKYAVKSFKAVDPIFLLKHNE